jgi:hypothetical protein
MGVDINDRHLLAVDDNGARRFVVDGSRITVNRRFVGVVMKLTADESDSTVFLIRPEVAPLL